MEKSTFTRDYALLRMLLRRHREAAQMTQVELGAALGESQSFVSKCERGEKRLDLVQLKAFCVALGVELVDFVSAFEAASNTRSRR